MKIFYLLLISTSGFANFISEEPICFAYTPKRASSSPCSSPLFAGERTRFSTSSGVAWMSDNTHLIAVNLWDSSITTYWFDKINHIFEPLWSLGKEEGINLYHPENLDISFVGNFIAFSLSGNSVDLYKIDNESTLMHPMHISLRHSVNDHPHGVAFSSNGTYLAYTSIDNYPGVCIYKNTEGSFQLHQTLGDHLLPLHPKGVAFSPDNQFLAICYCHLVGNKNLTPCGQLEIYAFNSDIELFTKTPISTFQKKPGSMETVKFSPDGSYLVTTDQIFDEVFIHYFDKTNGTLQDSLVLLNNPKANLNFPHGIAFSHDGKYLAVTNYGDDKVSIYSITENPQ